MCRGDSARGERGPRTRDESSDITGKKSSCGQLQPQTVAESNHKTTHTKNNAFLRKQAGRTEGPAQSPLPRFLLLSLPICFAGLFVSTVHLVPPPSPALSQRCPRHPSPAPSQPCAPAILQHQSPCTSRRGVAGGSARGKKTGR